MSLHAHSTRQTHKWLLLSLVSHLKFVSAPHCLHLWWMTPFQGPSRDRSSLNMFWEQTNVWAGNCSTNPQLYILISEILQICVSTNESRLAALRKHLQRTHKSPTTSLHYYIMMITCMLFDWWWWDVTSSAASRTTELHQHLLYPPDSTGGNNMEKAFMLYF